MAAHEFHPGDKSGAAVFAPTISDKTPTVPGSLPVEMTNSNPKHVRKDLERLQDLDLEWEHKTFVTEVISTCECSPDLLLTEAEQVLYIPSRELDLLQLASRS